MENKLKLITAISTLFFTSLGQTVNINSNGHGEVLLYPYYTVNNNMNTIYSVVNLTEQTKAVKVRFLEGEAGRDVLDFNVYLSAYDVWSGALLAVNSSVTGHVGEPSVTHVTGDTSCAPFLNKSGQEFLPFEIDADAGNNNLQRATDGHIEIIEMGTFIAETAAAADHGVVGVPANCTAIADFWGLGDVWTGDEEQLPTGGLAGSASILNVAAGIEFSYNALALENFWQGAAIHSGPGSLETHLGSGSPVSQIILNNEIQESTWSSGIEAVSAVLMQFEIYNEYAFDTDVQGKSEWVISFPTKNIHTVDLPSALQPFDETWDGAVACEEFSFNVFDRESQVNTFGVNELTLTPRPPAGANPSICYQTNVIQFIATGQTPGATSEIFAADNLISIEGVGSTVATENGWATIQFIGANQLMTPVEGSSYLGLPAIGFQVQQLTNNNAQPGLIAQYGRLFQHKGLTIN